jgi:hypothetical protein
MLCSEKKEQQLGMSLGKATRKLDRIILFSLIKKLGLDDCFRCGKKIESVRDLSIDHKKAWLDVDHALYWDEKNIAFSHYSCNYSAGGKVHRKWKSEREKRRAAHKRLYADPVWRAHKLEVKRNSYHRTRKNIASVG